uniref:cysteine dioxygenase n=1 Tax=Kalanchoe fedtschenkoi TaxID=63787 RepID=A0A7N0T1S3_KALFE
MQPNFGKSLRNLAVFAPLKSIIAAFSNYSGMTARRSSVQSLYELCAKTFRTSQPLTQPSQASQALSSLMDTIGPGDVGLKDESTEDDRGHGVFGLSELSRTARWSQPITYLDLYECDKFTMCIFCFPTSAVIPLHDHPGMCVFSKILYGSLHVKAYDWVEPSLVRIVKGPENITVRLAKLVTDKVMTAPCETSVLYPKRAGNVHCFTAVTPCAVLDVLAPPYLESAGRPCTYYHDYPFSSFYGADIPDKEGEYAWLAEIKSPDIYMRQGRYSGPAIQP